jgi:hypothetical protein
VYYENLLRNRTPRWKTKPGLAEMRSAPAEFSQLAAHHIHIDVATSPTLGHVNTADVLTRSAVSCCKLREELFTSEIQNG